MNHIYSKITLFRQITGIKRFQTSALACAERRKRERDPGVAKRAEIFKDDVEFIQSLEDEEDIASLESDFGTAESSYNEHKRLIRLKKLKTDKIITKKKFFADQPLPNMLTWTERIQIRKLHNEDPDTWNLDVLSESFPATREIISKILNQKWQPDNVEKLQKMDARVHANWKLLAQGKLDTDEVFLKHLQTFLHRREDHLKAMANHDISALLPAPKRNYRWNNGQMSKILESYEKALDVLDSKQSARIAGKDGVAIVNEKHTVFGTDTKNAKLLTLSELKESKIHLENVNLTELVVETPQKGVTARLTSLAGYEEKPQIFEEKRESLPEIDVKPVENNSPRVVTEAETKESDLEEHSIQDTFFWPSSELKQEIETGVVEKTASGLRKTGYPERIQIPKDKKGNGLIFKVNDCFYDNDGEFLYRVPGMVSKS